MTDIDTAARYAVEGRRSFPPRPLSPAQQAAALAYRGPENHGDPAFAREERRRLRINDDLTVRRRGDHIALVLGPAEIPLTNEQARRAAEALSFYAAAADAVDVEDEPVEAGSLGRAA